MENELQADQPERISSSILNFIAKHSLFRSEKENSLSFPLLEKITLKNIAEEIPCIHCKGIQYYDLKKINYLTNADIAQLIEILKPTIKEGKEIQFVNVNEKIKSKIKALKLQHVFNCTE